MTLYAFCSLLVGTCFPEQPIATDLFHPNLLVNTIKFQENRLSSLLVKPNLDCNLIWSARLVIEEVAVEVFCPRCRQPRRLPAPLPMACPECGTRTAEILRGRELELFALEGEEGEGVGTPDR